MQGLSSVIVFKIYKLSNSFPKNFKKKHLFIILQLIFFISLQKNRRALRASLSLPVKCVVQNA